MLASSRARAALPGPLPARFSFRLCWTEDCLYWISDHGRKTNLLDGERCTNIGHRNFLCCIKSISIIGKNARKATSLSGHLLTEDDR